MRTLDIALAAFALRALPAQQAKTWRRPVAAVDDADAALLDRAALSQQRAALIASLWPPARQCVVAPVYAELPAPALFGCVYRVTWRVPWRAHPAEDARALQSRLSAAF
jgi:hypothetical protein